MGELIVFTSLDVNALEAWLARNQPQTLLAYVDRLLVATVGNLEERSALVAHGSKWLAKIEELSSKGVLLTRITDALVAMSLLDEESVPTERCRRAVTPFIHDAVHHASSWAEPFKSVFSYWLVRAGMGHPLMIGSDPDNDLLRLYHTTHRIFYAADYGLFAVPRASFAEAICACQPFLDRLQNNGDVLAEMLLAEAMLVPRDQAQCSQLRKRLGAMQFEDGSIMMPPGATPEAVHHAACITFLAERLIKYPPRLRQDSEL